jgi:hypothetical protein
MEGYCGRLFASCYIRESESSLHAIWRCPVAQDVWGRGPVLFQKCAFMGDIFCSWWSIVWIDSLRLRWDLWLFSLEAYGLEGISSFLRIFSLILSRFIRIPGTPWMTSRDVI